MCQSRYRCQTDRQADGRLMRDMALNSKGHGFDEECSGGLVRGVHHIRIKDQGVLESVVAKVQVQVQVQVWFCASGFCSSLDYGLRN